MFTLPSMLKLDKQRNVLKLKKKKKTGKETQTNLT